MAQVIITDRDRDAEGNITVPMPSLQELYDESRRAIDGEPTAPAAADAEPAVPKKGTGPSRTTLLMIAAGLVLAIVLVVLLRSLIPSPVARSATNATALRSPAPTPVSPTPLPSPERPALPNGLAVYWSPGGQLAPSVGATAVYTPTGRYDQDWIELTLEGGGVVWTRSDALPLVDLAEMPDRAPPPTPTPRPVTPAAPPVSQPAAAPAAEQPCTKEVAAYHVARTVEVNGVPMASIQAFSCVSQAEAELHADEIEAQTRVDLAATQGVKTAAAVATSMAGVRP